MVGVILNLALWFGMHVLFSEVTTIDASMVHIAVPSWSSLVPIAAILAVFAALALLHFKLSVIKTLVLCAALSYALSLVM